MEEPKYNTIDSVILYYGEKEGPIEKTYDGTSGRCFRETKVEKAK